MVSGASPISQKDIVRKSHKKRAGSGIRDPGQGNTLSRIWIQPYPAGKKAPDPGLWIQIRSTCIISK
jgi:hypothetical protein